MSLSDPIGVSASHPGKCQMSLRDPIAIGFVPGRTNLAKGTVTGECLRCPLHGWDYNADGECERIPTTTEIPRWARQVSYPIRELAGHVFFFNRPEALFPFPQFEGVEWESLHAARPFEFMVDAPWYVASSNGFDLQHFRYSHDRELIGNPLVDAPHAFARRIVAKFKVAGASWRDALTRRFSGPEVTMSVTDWLGNLIFVEARFARTTSYGLLITPLIAFAKAWSPALTRAISTVCCPIWIPTWS